MIGIIAAMDKEVEAIEKILENKEKLSVSGIHMMKGKLEGKKVIVMKSGVGKGYAAMACTILLENFRISHVINIGTAGGLKIEQQVLDAVISDQVVQHDYDTTALDEENGLGERYKADPMLVDLCMDALHNMNVTAYRGLIASGDLFVAKDEDLKRLTTRFPDAICAEMEAGAIAQVCTHYQTPFVILRSLSDVAYHEDSQIDFLTYVELASARSAAFCKEMMKKMK